MNWGLRGGLEPTGAQPATVCGPKAAFKEGIEKESPAGAGLVCRRKEVSLNLWQ